VTALEMVFNVLPIFEDEIGQPKPADLARELATQAGFSLEMVEKFSVAQSRI